MNYVNNDPPPPATKIGGEDNVPVEVILASWTDRFVAWLIDFIIVSIDLGVLFALLAIPLWFSYYSNGMALAHNNLEAFHYLLSSLCILWILDLL